MKRLKQLMSAAILSILASTAFSQTTETTPNLITNTWNNVTTGTHPNDCCTGGPSPLYDPNTNTIHFSYGLTAVHQVIGINTALQGTGIQINGWNWGYDLRNMNGSGGQGGTDTISATSFITNSAGQIVKQSDQYYNTQFDWTRFTGTETLTSSILLENNVNLGIQFVASDSGFWAGYYGPQVRNVSLTANYTVDQCSVNPQSSPTCPGYKTYYNMWDDGYAQVNLPFAFPFYGRSFTTSYMFTNGVIGFLDTNLWGYCCDGTDLNQQAQSGNTSWNFAIYALNTDLYPGQQSTFYTQTTNNGQGLKYTWDRVVEIGTNLENTFSVELRNTGYIGINYQQVNLNPWRNTLIGIAGDVSQGQYSQYYYGPASSLPNLAGTTLTYTGTETTDICNINPLYNQSCPGYQQAYFNQQCSANPLYDPTCPGYAAAYLSYQCNLNQLYSPSCPGYQEAYLNQQCSINPLHSTSCSGYQTASTECSSNPLYASYCPGYTTAIGECSTNGLLHTYCPTYQTELNYCSTDPLFNNLCPTYQTAFSQCSLNPLTASYCPNYLTATNQCTINPLTASYCPGYQTATESCSTNSLNHSYCPNYSTAQAQCSINPLSNTLCSDFQTATTQCNANQLNYSYCPGYTSALNYCSTDPLSNIMCPTYQSSLTACTANPLSNSYCPGYSAASSACSTNSLSYAYCPGYTNALTQCDINPLSNTLCSSYQTATASCSANSLNHSYCPGYQTALTTCSTNPLSNTLCSGYTAASTACSANQLTYSYCPNYTTTLASCSTNPQSNTMCPGYSVTASTSSGTTSLLSVASTTSDPVASAAPVVSDPVVNQTITTTSTSTSPASAATATVPLVSAPSTTTTTAAVASTSTENTKEETKTTDSSSPSTATTASSTESKKEQPKTMRQQIQEQRVAAARAKAVEAGKDLANKMGEAASMEAQVAVQNVVIQAMGFTPGFDTYNRAMLPDAQGYRPFEIYPGQRVIDNPQGRRFMTGSDRLHAEMVDQQYSKEK